MDSTRLSYQKLRNLTTGDEAAEELQVVLRRRLGRRWRRPRVRVAGLLRRKAGLVGAAIRKVVRRFKEGKPYLGELFAGNYMFMQVNPNTNSKTKYLNRSFLPHDHHQYYLPPATTNRLSDGRLQLS